MSLLTTIEAVPSRILAVLDFLLREGRPVDREILELMLSPINLRPEKSSGNMVRQVVNEAVGLGVAIGEAQLELSPRLTDCVVARTDDPSAVRQALMALLSGGQNKENQDLCKALSWLLLQDPFKLRGDFDGLQDALRVHFGGDRLGVTNDARDGNLRYWAVYLGLAWSHAIPRGDRVVNYIVPDPTNYLRSTLPGLFANAGRSCLGIHELLERLSAQCPLFQFGRYGSDLAQRLSFGVELTVAPAVALAMTRLTLAGHISLSDRADAPRMKCGDRPGITHVDWIEAPGVGD